MDWLTGDGLTKYKQKQRKYIRAARFGRKTGFKIRNERKGKVNEAQNW